MSENSKVIIVTGANGNLGRAVVAELLGHGNRVVAVGQCADPEFGVDSERRLWIDGGDLSEVEACDRIVRTTLGHFGRLDGAVATVGGFAFAHVGESTPDLFDRMYRINVLPTLNIFRAALPSLASGGSLVAVGAGAGVRANAGFAAYAGAKAAVLRMVESFSDELKGQSIRVNAVLPGVIDTPQNRAAMPGADTSTWVSPSQIAAVTRFLVSDAASGVTGALIPVTGRG